MNNVNDIVAFHQKKRNGGRLVTNQVGPVGPTKWAVDRDSDYPTSMESTRFIEHQRKKYSTPHGQSQQRRMKLQSIASD